LMVAERVDQLPGRVADELEAERSEEDPPRSGRSDRRGTSQEMAPAGGLEPPTPGLTDLVDLLRDDLGLGSTEIAEVLDVVASILESRGWPQERPQASGDGGAA
jgi:hypothetical protein